MTDPSAQTMLEQFANELERCEHGTMLIDIAKAIRSIALRAAPADVREAREALEGCREFLVGMTKPAAPGVLTISSYSPCHALIDKIDRALAVTRPNHGGSNG